jgi:hypothetical protein
MILLSLLVSLSGHAEENPQLTAYFEQKLTSMESRADSLPPQGAITLSDVNIDIMPSVSFGVNGILNLSISPELDLVLSPQLQ